ncbi:hypothetical protein [Persicitalea sp.]|uniref:hypothetical protein n=1 Tax=Persicitalea sp. TaxID=3100273 RepID=UPI003593DBF9
MAVLQQPLTNLQLELLQLYSLNLPEDELIEIKRVIAKHFADKASTEFDKLWIEGKWTNDTMNDWITE